MNITQMSRTPIDIDKLPTDDHLIESECGHEYHFPESNFIWKPESPSVTVKAESFNPYEPRPKPKPKIWEKIIVWIKEHKIRIEVIDENND